MDSQEITGTIKEVEGKAEKNFGRAKDRVRSAADDLIDESNRTRTKLYDRAEETWEGAVDAVRERPGAAVGIALAAGLVLGALIAIAAKRD